MVMELSSEIFWGACWYHNNLGQGSSHTSVHNLHPVHAALRECPLWLENNASSHTCPGTLAPVNRLPHVTKGTLPSWLRLEMGKVSPLPGWTQCNHQGPHSKWTGEAGASQSKMSQEVRVMWLLEGARGQGTWWPLEAGKVRETDSSWSLWHLS